MASSFQSLPIEIVNKIFLFVSSPTSRLIRESSISKEVFPFTQLRRHEETFPFPTNVQIDYRRIYRKLTANAVHNSYRRFHEHCMEKNLDDIDHDGDMDPCSDSDIIEKHLLYFIFHHRYWYDKYQDQITQVYEAYMNRPWMFERNPWMFRKMFSEGNVNGFMLVNPDDSHIFHEDSKELKEQGLWRL